MLQARLVLLSVRRQNRYQVVSNKCLEQLPFVHFKSLKSSQALCIEAEREHDAFIIKLRERGLGERLSIQKCWKIQSKFSIHERSSETSEPAFSDELSSRNRATAYETCSTVSGTLKTQSNTSTCIGNFTKSNKLEGAKQTVRIGGAMKNPGIK